jgi:hypothetical protein
MTESVSDTKAVGNAGDENMAAVPRKRKAQHIGLPLWISLFIYILLGVLMTWPLARELSTHVPTPDSDVFNVYWGNWWVRYALGNGLDPYFTKYLIYPIGFNLISFAFSPFLALLWIPLSWFLPPLVAYNLVFLMTIVLCCVAMDQLVRYLTGNAWAALVAGITFSFAPSLVAERACHLNLATLFWIPWAALLLTRLMREAKVRDAILLAVTVGLAFYTRLQLGILVVMSIGVYFVGLALVERRRWQKLAIPRLLLAGGLCLLSLSPLVVKVWQTQQQTGGEALLRGEAEGYQTDLLAYVLPPQQHPLFGSWTSSIYEQRFAINRQYWAYIGLVPLLLTLYAMISQPRKAFPWLLTATFFFVLALGPDLRFNGNVYPSIKLPYQLASGLFSAVGLNWSNRFNLPMMAAVSVLVGLACAQIQTRFNRTWLLVIAALLILSEYVVVPQRTILAPPHSAFYDQMAADEENYALVDLPLTRSDGEIQRYYQTIHHKPIVGGWDHRVPDSAFAFIDSNPLLAPWRADDLTSTPGTAPDKALADLAAANVRYFVIHKHQLGAAPESMRFLLTALKPVYQDRDILVLRTESTSNQGYNVAHWFSENVGFIRPTVFLYLPGDGRPPTLSLYACWLSGEQDNSVDGYRVTLAEPDGVRVYEKTVSLPYPLQALACEFLTLEWAPPFQAGEYDLSITPLAGKQPLGTYTMSLPIQVLQMRKGIVFPAWGSASPVTFDTPMELLGYNLVGGDGFVWTDLFWRSTAKHRGSHSLSVHLVDPETGQSVAYVDAVIPEQEWKRGDLYQERRVLWLDDVPPGRYSLAVALDGLPAPGQGTSEPSPGGVVVLDAPVLVLPASSKDSVVPEKGWIVAYTSAAPAVP